MRGVLLLRVLSLNIERRVLLMRVERVVIKRVLLLSLEGVLPMKLLGGCFSCWGWICHGRLPGTT